jgi:hypothetical protein
VKLETPSTPDFQCPQFENREIFSWIFTWFTHMNWLFMTLIAFMDSISTLGVAGQVEM